MTAEERFWDKVAKTNGCWVWLAATNQFGYGRFYDGGRLVSAHRFSYELTHGPIPDDLTIDHLCRVPGCVRPDHLEAVTHRENVLRGNAVNREWCRKGLHRMTPDNRIPSPSRQDYRYCGECRKAWLKSRLKRRPKDGIHAVPQAHSARA